MAFVFRNKQELYPRSKTPGPGTEPSIQAIIKPTNLTFRTKLRHQPLSIKHLLEKYGNRAKILDRQTTIKQLTRVKHVLYFNRAIKPIPLMHLLKQQYSDQAQKGLGKISSRVLDLDNSKILFI